MISVNGFRPREIAAGATLSVVLALAAYAIAYRYGAPAMLMGLLLGLSCHFLSESDRFVRGLVWASGPCLRFGVALLGLRLSVGDVAALGWTAVLAVCAAVFMTLFFGVIWSRALGCDRDLGLLTGGAVGICGASAAMAISAALPESELKQRHTLFTVIGVTTFSTAAMVFYPIFGDLLQFTPTDMGFFIGATIHDVAQVVGAGYSVSSETGDLATFVKLLRVAMLVPVVMGIAFLCRSPAPVQGASESVKPSFPLFLLGFVALFLLNNSVSLPAAMTQWASQLATGLLLLAVTALGVRTSLREVASIGWRPIALLGGETVFLAVVIASLLLLGVV
ncbi:MAG: putative sulfate exporter family transporter [Luminiphilus sp.]|nr:putative sulfate exporter family transporter [Luminiphilus sp.]